MLDIFYTYDVLEFDVDSVGYFLTTVQKLRPLYTLINFLELWRLKSLQYSAEEKVT